MLPALIAGKPKKETRERALSLLEDVKLADRKNHFPSQLSGGERQRVAVARSLINSPSLVLADEPTGALDSASTEMILNLFRKINETGQTILMVTHSLRAAAFAKRVIFIKDGVVYHELYRGDKESLEEFMERINNSQKQLFTSNYSQNIK